MQKGLDLHLSNIFILESIGPDMLFFSWRWEVS